MYEVVPELEGTKSGYQQGVCEVGGGVPEEGLVERLVVSHYKAWGWLQQSK